MEAGLCNSQYIKRVPNTPFTVDGFRFPKPGCKSYFLTHAHSDHTTGLYPSFRAGTIYCSQVTANFIIGDLRIPAHCVRALPMDTPVTVEGVSVTLIDANHCPGAVLFLFRTKAPPHSEHPMQASNILHTGDMRWHARMGQHPALRSRRIDLLFLDTTYAAPQHVFPSQEDAIATIIRLMQSALAKHPDTLFVMGSYRIGKERAYLGAARALGCRVWVNPDKMRVLRLLRLPARDLALLTPARADARIHVAFMGKGLLPEALQARLDEEPAHSHIVAFRPTGWSFRKKGLDVRRAGNVTIYGVPYSEHSSFAELRECVKTLRPVKIVPTVNASNPAALRRLVDRFADLMDLSKDRSRLDYFLRKAPTAPPDLAPSPASAPASQPPAVATSGPAALAAQPLLGGAASAPACTLDGSGEGALGVQQDAGKDMPDDGQWPAEDGMQWPEEEADEEGGASEEEQDDDEVLAAREALWQQAVLAEEEGAGCREKQEERCVSEEAMSCAAEQQQEPEGVGAGDTAGTEAGCSGRGVKSEDGGGQWGSREGEQGHWAGQQGGDEIEEADPLRADAVAACKREGSAEACGRGSKRRRADLVLLGLDSPPSSAGPGAFSLRPRSSATAQAQHGCKAEGPGECRDTAAEAPGDVTHAQQQQRAGARPSSQDSWSLGEQPPAATGRALPLQAAAMMQEAQPCNRTVRCGNGGKHHGQRQAQGNSAGPSRVCAGGSREQPVDLTAVDLAEQERILREIEANRRRALLRKGCGAAGKAAKGRQVSIGDFFARKA